LTVISAVSSRFSAEGQNLFKRNFVLRKTFLSLSNQAGKIFLIANQFAWCPVLYETPESDVQNENILIFLAGHVTFLTPPASTPSSP